MSLFAAILGLGNADSLASQFFWSIGWLGLFLIVLMGVIGIFVGHHGDTDGGDMSEGHGFVWSNYLSIKSIAALLLGVGFGGAFFSEQGFSTIVAALGGIAIGLTIALSFVALMKGFHQLRSDGTARLWEAIGQRATVYMRIPGAETAPGEIQVVFGGRMMNVPAFTRGPELPTGTDVLVISVHGDHALEVEQAPPPHLKIS